MEYYIVQMDHSKWFQLADKKITCTEHCNSKRALVWLRNQALLVLESAEAVDA